MGCTSLLCAACKVAERARLLHAHARARLHAWWQAFACVVASRPSKHVQQQLQQQLQLPSSHLPLVQRMKPRVSIATPVLHTCSPMYQLMNDDLPVWAASSTRAARACQPGAASARCLLVHPLSCANGCCAHARLHARTGAVVAHDHDAVGQGRAAAGSGRQLWCCRRCRGCSGGGCWRAAAAATASRPHLIFLRGLRICLPRPS